MPVEQASPDALWTDLHARMTSFVRGRIDDPHAAEDVAQEILLRLHRSLGALRDEDRLHAFAYRIARNAITDHHRSTRELVIAPEDVATRLDAGAASEDDESEAWRELVCCLEPLIGRLAAPYRDALLLTDLGDLSQVQAAEHAGLTVPGMKARVQRAAPNSPTRSPPAAARRSA
jgi:RNA polymerase sigma-70 factor (ECF subfamily)